MVIPSRGPAGLYGPSCEAVAELAARELDAEGGVLGRPVAIEVVDGGRAPHHVAAEVGALLDAGRIDAVSGWHISSVRNALVPVVAGRVPYVYTSLYEGGERRPGVVCCGETPRDQIAPALRWLRDHIGVRNWFVVGDDYVWPRASTAAVRRYARELGLRIAGEAFVRLGSGATDGLVRRVARTPCDGVLMFLVGQDAVEFNRRFAACGLDERVVRFSPLVEENTLLAAGAEANRNLFAAAAYFRSAVSPDALDLVGRYVALHGPTAPPLNNAAESCYEGLRTLALLVRRAGTDRLPEVTAALDGLAYHGPRGTVEFRDRDARQHVQLAAADGYDFDVVTRL